MQTDKAIIITQQWHTIIIKRTKFLLSIIVLKVY